MPSMKYSSPRRARASDSQSRPWIEPAPQRAEYVSASCRWQMIIRSAGFVDASMIGSQNALNFAYILYLLGATLGRQTPPLTPTSDRSTFRTSPPMPTF
jgi:hypothetical protein